MPRSRILSLLTGVLLMTATFFSLFSCALKPPSGEIVHAYLSAGAMNYGDSYSFSLTETEDGLRFSCSEDNGEGFVDQPLDFDIFTDEEYADKDKGVYFYSDNVGFYYTTEDREDAPYQARLFIDYFDAAIRGDGKKLNTLFTDDYFKNNGRPIKKYPDRFPMQKIYAAKVERIGTTTTENTIEGTMIYEYYKVSFLLKDNNGAFRPDLPEPDGGMIPLIFDVITLKGESRINRISMINYTN